MNYDTYNDAELFDLALQPNDHSLRMTLADLRDIGIERVSTEIEQVLSALPSEVLGLRRSVVEGLIDGSFYTYGPCVCLKGTLARLHEPITHYGTLYEFWFRRGIELDSLSPSELFVSLIKETNTPNDNPASAFLLRIIDRWLHQALTS